MARNCRAYACPDCGYCSEDETRTWNHMRYFAFPGHCKEYMLAHHSDALEWIEGNAASGRYGTMVLPHPKVIHSEDTFLSAFGVSVVHPLLRAFQAGENSMVEDWIVTPQPASETRIPLPTPEQMDWVHLCCACEFTLTWNADREWDPNCQARPMIDPIRYRCDAQTLCVVVPRKALPRWMYRLDRERDRAEDAGRTFHPVTVVESRAWGYRALELNDIWDAEGNHVMTHPSDAPWGILGYDEPTCITPETFHYGFSKYMHASMYEHLTVSYTHLTLPTIYSV